MSGKNIMSNRLRPADTNQAIEMVRRAVEREEPLEIVGGGSKRGLGRPFQATHTLDLSALDGITLYEPEELVLSAGAATPLAEIERVLAEHRQQLAFEPPDFAPLFGDGGRATLGGTLAANLSGPRRIKAGAARDHFLGLIAISGHGELFKAGGRVVKNVTGYDLCKVFAGSFGTLGVLTEVTVKVLPAPETGRTVIVRGLGDAAAVAALSRALGSAHEVSGAAHLPERAAARSAVPQVASAGAAVTAIRVEGFEPSVRYRVERLRAELSPLGEVGELEDTASRSLWREIRDVAVIMRGANDIVWKLSVPPVEGPRVVAEIRRHLPVDVFYDWGGGLIWLAPDETGEGGDAGGAIIRDAIGTGRDGAAKGHATLIRASEAIRAATPVFHPQPAPLAALTARVKESFDPKRIFNPGRMYPGV